MNIYSNWTSSSFLDMHKKYVVIFTAAAYTLLLYSAEIKNQGCIEIKCTHSTVKNLPSFTPEEVLKLMLDFPILLGCITVTIALVHVA